MKATMTSHDFIRAHLALLDVDLTHPDIPEQKPLDKPQPRPARDNSRPCALLFMPHPDDETITAALPYRLMREENWQIINVALTLGSNRNKRTRRFAELTAGCNALDFDFVLPGIDGFNDVSATSREINPADWKAKVDELAEIIRDYNPQAIFMPHATDWNATHIGCHLLGRDAIHAANLSQDILIFDTEYWHPNPKPTMMIGLSEIDAATLLNALSCYVGENSRNPFSLTFPPYLIDTARRGSEVISGKGEAHSAFAFAMLYGQSLWRNHSFVEVAERFIIGPEDKLRPILSI